MVDTIVVQYTVDTISNLDPISNNYSKHYSTRMCNEGLTYARSKWACFTHPSSPM